MSWAPGTAPPFGFCFGCPNGTVLQDGMLEATSASTAKDRDGASPYGTHITPETEAVLNTRGPFTELWMIHSTIFAHSVARYAPSIVDQEILMVQDTVAPDQVARNMYNLINALASRFQTFGSHVDSLQGYLDSHPDIMMLPVVLVLLPMEVAADTLGSSSLRNLALRLKWIPSDLRNWNQAN